MISGIFHKGSGLGNQLHRYVGARVAALEKGEEFGMVAPDLFKGKDFLNLDMGKVITDYHVLYPEGRTVPNVVGTFLDEEFQNELIWNKDEQRLFEVRKWLRTEPLGMPENECVINFRGGEYKIFPELYLPKEYWDMAVALMREIDPKMKFTVHTDDPAEARRFFPDFLVVNNDIGFNWRSIKNARYLILSNSSFAILPAYIGLADKIIAPKYWARYNTKQWINPDNATYSKFTYIHHEENTR